MTSTLLDGNTPVVNLKTGDIGSRKDLKSIENHVLCISMAQARRIRGVILEKQNRQITKPRYLGDVVEREKK